MHDDDMEYDEDEDKDAFPIAATAASAALLAATSRIEALEAQVTASQEERARAVYANGCPIGAQITMTQEVADLLYPLWRADTKALDVIKASIVKPEATATATSAIVMTSAWNAIGGADDSASPTKFGKEEALAEARITATANGTKISAEYKKLLNRVEA
jgi:hypothetical protein